MTRGKKKLYDLIICQIYRGQITPYYYLTGCIYIYMETLQDVHCVKKISIILCNNE